MDEDTGVPWLTLPKTYKGKFEVAVGDGVTMTSPYVMLSSDNDVSFMGNATCAAYTTGAVLLTLPEECCPNETLMLFIPADIGGNIELSIMSISPIGEVTLAISGDITVHLNGKSFNIGSNWYSQEV